ncbi:MAG: succinylglutamate desuccinylase/aspartoacylase family protein [Lewinellaceae bacterium]|nr:succinylglutamate desuccinylase/aspartoacylase family protein [Lewinellaceae bacterium]
MEEGAVNQGRIIGKYSSGMPGGPLLVVMGAIHGNEPAGVDALRELFDRLDQEPRHNPTFQFRGHLLAMIGNQAAYRSGERFITKDINRHWTPEHIQWLRQQSPADLQNEDAEMSALVTIIEDHLRLWQPTRLIILDLHTTSVQGGIFAISRDDPAGIRLAMGLHAPVITGMLGGLRGTMLHYFTEAHFPLPTTPLAFEAGHHQDPLAVRRHLAAVINCMRSLGCVRPQDVDNEHDNLLLEYSQQLPRVSRLIYSHGISAEDNFTMLPGFHNFQPIYAGQVLAQDKRGWVVAPEDGLLLMPLYQKQGSEGFFLVRPLREYGGVLESSII